MSNPFFPKFEELPAVIPVFPLNGTCLLPGVPLHLNVFESRYLDMVQDSISGSRLLGMVQPSGPDPGSEERPDLYETGCAGRITSYSETDDGRILIGLAGVCRFKIDQEIERHCGYRRVVADWTSFRADMEEMPEPRGDAKTLIGLSNRFLGKMGMSLETKPFEKMQLAALVNFLAVYLPFEPAEKQALVETPDINSRLSMIESLCNMALNASDNPPSASH